MTQPATIPLMPLDSAWRQWRRTTETAALRADAKDGTAADLTRANADAEQARTVWLQTSLGWFGRRLAEARETGRETGSDKALKALGVPCSDCLRIAGAADKKHKIVRDDKLQYPIRAECGGDPVDPTAEPMPTW